MSAWLIDKSALLRLDDSPDSDEWIRRIQQGVVRVSTVTLLEIGFSARSAGDFRSVINEPPVSLMPREYLIPQIEDRALEIQGLLADRGQHRAPSAPDLLIAATAERIGLAILHVDRDYELIANVTGQPVELLPLAEQN